jgi:hypothetical protein
MSNRQQRIDLGLASPHGAISAADLAAIEKAYTGAGGYATYDAATGTFKEQTREEFGKDLLADLERAAAEPQSPQPPPGRKHARDLRWCPFKEGSYQLASMRRMCPTDYELEDTFHWAQDPLKLGIAERVGYDEARRREAAGLPSLRDELGAWLQAGCPLDDYCSSEEKAEEGCGDCHECGACDAAYKLAPAQELPSVEPPEELLEELTLPEHLEELDYKRLAALRRGDQAAVDAVETATAALVRKHYPAQAHRLPEKMDPAEVDVNMLSMFAESPLMEALYAVGWTPARAPFQEPLGAPSPGPPRSKSPAAAPPPPEPLRFAPKPLALIMKEEAALAAEARGQTTKMRDTVARGPPAAPPPVPKAQVRLVPRAVELAAPPKRIQVWKSAKLLAEEAAEDAKVAAGRAAYHERRQKELEAAGAPRCYNCGWYGHLARVCRNERVEREPRQHSRQPSAGLTLSAFLGDL